ncbi:MAG: primase protein [Candidatus Wolfebacteria bacterium GW2011_GWA2_42_10]|uniref:DNA primase n=2 Tax=Candidatus Wolfeibacteriota TaxID=1752735 RepID=A0A0G0XL44_9BACT|nr:MAG: primase protein [Candidatus Wolfebacteria bacterium GW2011_GWB1_41_12]KKS25599.1 MAG: primase protein [Candidatus Wolfebacteria bacterium GW2011_GWA2_42_10]KKT56510.1 MAG: primase protein [Candidatus Wolfebacteria bacterium GW2011_GWA1_44_24]
MTPIEQIKDKIDIVEFIRSYIPLSPAGKNFKALCPFHKEKTPSFIISPERQTWHCFGSCSEGGDVFKFLMKYENLEFYEALKILAEKAGVELKKTSPMEQRQFEILYEINDAAKDFFILQLADEKNKEALEYLYDRGLKKETIEEFELGFAPQGFDQLTLVLIKKGFAVKDIERAGLNFKTEKGNYVDRFRNRIMFPIHNHFGKTIGFSGRIMPKFDTGEMGKYVNSPETPIFSKSKILYGFYASKKFIREENSAVLVEGQMDFLMAHQDGVKNTAAVSGTALTPDHLKTLRRQTENLVFCFDNDEAGFKAAERSIDLANSLDFSVKILTLDEYKDPAEVAAKKPGILANLIKKSESAMEFYFSRYLSEGKEKKDLSEFKKNLRIILEKIKNLASPIEQSHWLKELSLKTGVKEEALADEMKQLKLINRLSGLDAGQPINRQIIQLNSRRETIIQRLIGLMMVKDEWRNQMKNYLNYLPNDYLAIAESLINRTKLKDERLLNLLNLISLRSSFEFQNFEEEKINFEYQELLGHLHSEYFKEKREEMTKLLKEAEKSEDEEKISSILKEFDEISKIIHNRPTT